MKKSTEIGITEDHTIGHAKKILREHANEGFICPCCEQPAKVYRRTITSAMACGLILLYRASKKDHDPDGYIHIENFFKEISNLPASIRADIPKLRFWNLLEPKPGEKEDGNPSNGFYKVTWLGKQFVEGNLPVQKIITIYNNRRLGQVNEAGTITIQQALKNKFNYNSLLSYGVVQPGIQ